jgi:uncharacterized membrane protein YkoI
MSLQFRQLLLAFAVVVAPVGNASAEPSDQDALWSAVERGEIRSLAELIRMVRGKLPREIAGIEIERDGVRWGYEFSS